jgi:hypothetical protein
MNRVTTVHRSTLELESIFKTIQSTWHSNSSPIHNLYRDRFNLIDILDRYWGEIKDHHGNQQWKSRFLFSIMRFFIFNCWVIFTQNQYEDWRDFRANLANKLTQYNL